MAFPKFGEDGVQSTFRLDRNTMALFKAALIANELTQNEWIEMNVRRWLNVAMPEKPRIEAAT